MSTIAIVASKGKTPEDQKVINKNITALVEECAQNGVDVRMVLDMRNPSLSAALAATKFALDEHPNAKATIIEPWPNTLDQTMARARGIVGENMKFESSNTSAEALKTMQSAHEGGKAEFNKAYPPRASRTNLQLTHAAVIHGTHNEDTASAVVVATDTTAEKLDTRVAAALKLAEMAELPVFDINKAMEREEITAFVNRVKEHDNTLEAAAEVGYGNDDLDFPEIPDREPKSPATILKDAAEFVRANSEPEALAQFEPTLLKIDQITDSNFPSKITSLGKKHNEIVGTMMNNAMTPEDKMTVQEAIATAIREKAERKAEREMSAENQNDESHTGGR